MLLSCGVAFISYLDRAILGVTILPMAAELGWDESFEGAISSAFFVGYTITNVAAGWLCMRHTAVTVLQIGVWSWSLFTMLTPAAARTSRWLMVFTRFLTGAGEGVTFPALQMVVSNWVTMQDCRRLIRDIGWTGASLGTITAYATAPFITEQYDWPAVFTIYGLVGFVWTLLWSLLVTEKPLVEVHDSLEETTKEQEDTSKDIPWTSFARCLPLWAIIIVETSSGVGHYMCFFWQPSYYSEVYGESLQNVSLYSIIPFVAAAVSTNVAGWTADALASHKYMGMTSIRKTMQGIASFGPAICLILLSFDGKSALHAMGVFTAITFFAGCHAAGSGSQHLDINARYAAVMYGLTNGISSMLEAGGIAATGIILHRTQSWFIMFQAVAAFHIFGGLVYIVARHGWSKFGHAFANVRDTATPRHACPDLRTLVTMQLGDDYRLLRLTEPQKAVSGPDNASKHIGNVSKHLYKHVICVWGVVGSFPGVQAAKNGQKRSNVTLT
ncbi:MFS general substrate transporter [Coccomyxa subellipsoidea C-169]|uniref:MFS general substrate transporter n=1 Tax=Coccomyxa subellipsoidea (strain C-169) TaxID=574566 RepID=I0YVI6_COCSC|nr:MFS general substrate transporter [Coccomyxa subellipsoidea C-169]EIE22405.1 MFS general substrate transporter [Coccomyxa subellipsoidea C-169]|eukprot:XP_005646949.1 MFS general substrate transporter [Coccomyxa subellipsoidea C-169]